MSLNQRLTSFYKVVAEKHDSLVQIIDDAWARVKVTNEVPRLEAFLAGRGQGLEYMNSKVPALFAGLVVKFAAILVHKKPTVVPLSLFEPSTDKLGLAHHPELGDLYVIFLYLDAGKYVRVARSILYQAKNSRASQDTALAAKDAHQIYLYDKAQGFRYRDAPLAPNERRLPISSSRRRALHYLFVSEVPVTSSPSPSDKPGFIPWSEAMFRLMLDAEGLGLAANAPRGDGWSQIGADLVGQFKSNSLKARHLEELASWFNDFRDPSHWYARAGEDTIGINTLLIIVHDRELQEAPPSKRKGKPSKR